MMIRVTILQKLINLDAKYAIRKIFKKNDDVRNVIFMENYKQNIRWEQNFLC